MKAIQLSPKRKAIAESSLPALIIGGPGSGKTTLSLFAAKGRISSLKGGQQALFLSFSRAAVSQVMLRCSDVLSRTELDAVVVKTYHSFCLDLLRAHGRLFSGEPSKILFPSPEKLAKAKFEGDWIGELDRLAIEENVFAFDKFASGASRLLEESHHIRNLISDRYPLIIFDEFQDTSADQWRLVQALDGSELLFLADEDQRIFDFDSSVDPLRLDHLRKAFAPVEFDLGSSNHRSPDSAILKFANAVYVNDRVLPQTDDVRQATFGWNTFDEVLHRAVRVMYNGLSKKSVASPTIAVLCRSNNLVLDVSWALDKELAFQGKMLGPVRHEVVWDDALTASSAEVIAAALELDDDNETIAKLCDSISDYFELKNATSPSKSATEQMSKWALFAQQLRNSEAYRKNSLLFKLVEAVSHLSYSGRAVEDWIAARNVLDQVSALVEISRNARFVRRFQATDAIGAGLARLWTSAGSYVGARGFIRSTLQNESLMSNRLPKASCTLMTMHKSKGKEFDGVILVEGARKGSFFSVGRDQWPFESDRRLLRVALTRARHSVILVRPEKRHPLTGVARKYQPLY